MYAIPAVEQLSTSLSGDEKTGAGLVVAAAMADGKTRIEQENLIERGYENLVSRVSEIGIRAKKCL